MTVATPNDPLEAIAETEAKGEIASLFADIRDTLGVEVVNLVWRHLATMPGALEWVWSTLKPLYLGRARAAAEDVRRSLSLPAINAFSQDTLTAAGLDSTSVATIRVVLDSYYHTNALALVAFSAFLVHTDGKGSRSPPHNLQPPEVLSDTPPRVALPRLTPLSELTPPIARLVDELNRFGEDSDVELVASMYRHLSHWPSYLALVRTLMLPLHVSGQLQHLVDAARRLGEGHGHALAPLLSSAAPPKEPTGQVVAAVRRFATHPIARMTGVCATHP